MLGFEGTDSYIATPDLHVAVNAAIALERPLSPLAAAPRESRLRELRSDRLCLRGGSDFFDPSIAVKGEPGTGKTILAHLSGKSIPSGVFLIPQNGSPVALL